MKHLVMYFSPTGGTATVAQLIAAELQAPTVDITSFSCDTAIEADTLLFLCFPVYGGRIPSPMYARMETITGSGTPVVQVAVYGNRAVDDALLEMSLLCKKQGFKTVAGCEMIAPHSLDKHFAAGRPDTRDIAGLKDFLKKLGAKEQLTELRMPGNPVFKKYEGVPMRPSSGKNCTGCGTCAMECPAGAIDPEMPQQPDKTKCISCMRCVSVCPSEARKLPAAMQVAAKLSLSKLCAGRKEPKFYL